MAAVAAAMETGVGMIRSRRGRVRLTGGGTRFAGALVAAMSVVSGTAEASPGNAAEEPFTRVRPYNLSSHLPSFFRELLTGRVWVYQRRGEPAAVFFGGDGRLQGCWLRKDGSGFVRSHESMRWRIGTPSGMSNLQIAWATEEGPRYYRMVVIYDGRTGRFHGERFSTTRLAWYVARDGWLQETWPAALAERCAGLGIDPDIPVNRAQKKLDFEDLKRNAAPVVKHPGWERSFFGATGLGASGGKPTVTLEEALAARRAGHGKISIGMSGDRWVPVVWERYAELWKVDENDDVLDLAITRRTPDGSIVLLRWEKSGVINSYHMGYPLPMVVTERRHSAFEMMDALAAGGKPVLLVDGKGERREHVFAEGGGVRAGGVAGEWWISRGAVVVKTPSAEERYPWRDVAGASGWKRDAR